MSQVRVTCLQELKDLPYWVAHKDKVPKNPSTGGNASSTNPKTWGTAAEAWDAKQRFGFDGIGLVFTIELGIVGVDLDDCFEKREDGARHWKPWAQDIVQCLDSYTEYSPSRNGVHILTRGEVPFSITKSQLGFEMYNEARFFTVTGNMLGDVQEFRERSAELQALHAVYSDVPRATEASNLWKRAQTAIDSPSIDQMRDMLAVLPIQQDYYDWLRVLMAVHSAYPGEDGIRLVEAWSPGYCGEVANKFRSFDGTAKDGVRIGTLVHMAKQHGYSVEKHRRRPSSFAERLTEMKYGR
jgi:putative DNA primase/helicase